MGDTASELTKEMVRFFTIHFYEIVLIILVLAILDVVVYLLSQNKKDRIIILSPSSLLSRVFKKLIAH